ncbi:MAG: serine/threonine protein kinase [Deltaproteobacteria bacterium]|nr:serine/threonine protein kinase [Deltaproteobacteria bacterium]
MNIRAHIAAEGYTILKEFEAGGMAHVFLAEDPSGDPCVVKTPRESMLPAKSRFYDEARLGTLVCHPHLAETLHFFDVGERPFLVVEYVDGPSLGEQIQEGPLSFEKILQVGTDILEVLSAIHNATTHDGTALHAVHRDVTPQNILLQRGGPAKLIDLGICSFATRVTTQTQAGAVCGTLHFIAPELWSGSSFSPSSDVWSLGMCLLEALSGEKVVSGSFANVVHTLMKDEYLDAALEKLAARGIPQPMLSLLREMLALNPHGRPTTADLCRERFIQLQKVYGAPDKKQAEVDDVLAAFLGIDNAAAPVQPKAEHTSARTIDIDGFAALPGSMTGDEETDRTERFQNREQTQESGIDLVIDEDDFLADVPFDVVGEGTLTYESSLMDLLDAESEVPGAIQDLEASEDEASFASLADDDDDQIGVHSASIELTMPTNDDAGLAVLLEPNAGSSGLSSTFAARVTSSEEIAETAVEASCDTQLSLQERNLLYNDMFRALAKSLAGASQPQKIAKKPLQGERSTTDQGIIDYIAILRTLERPKDMDSQEAASCIFQRLENGMPLFPWEVACLQMPKASNAERSAAQIEWLIPETAV